MASDPRDKKKIEELTADLRMQRRLTQGMQRQMAELLNAVADLQKELDKKKKKKKKKSKKKGGKKQTSECVIDEAPKAPDRKTVEKPNQPKGVPRWQPPPDHLARNTVHHRAHIGACCSAPLVVQGDDKVIEQRNYTPATVDVTQHRIEQWGCENCGVEHEAPLPEMALPTGSMSGNLLAWVAYNKCGINTSLARIGEYLATLGLRLASSTMCNAMAHVGRLLEPIYDRAIGRMLASPVVLLDGTGMNVLQPGETGKHRGQFAVYCTDELSVYGYSESKHGSHFSSFLRIGEHDAYRGFLVTDAASNMDLLEDAPGLERCGCWQHGRNNFKNARVSAPIEAEEAIAWIGTLFDVEHQADAAGDTPEQRLARRRRDTQPLMEGFQRWMTATQPKFDPSEDLYKAIQYCSNQMAELQMCLTDGQIPLTNNLAERELGVIGRGRRGFLFAGSDASGEQLAKIYTVVRTCQRMAIAPFEYLAWVLPKLSDLPVNRGKGHLDGLTPWGYRDMLLAE
jgi:transposase